MILDQQVFCEEVVRYAGDVIALVVGENEAQVDAALSAINVEIEPLPGISSISAALRPDAPVLHPRLREINPTSPNILKHRHIRKGNPDRGFEEADLIYEQSYTVPFVEHAYMETETSIGIMENTGMVTPRRPG